MGSMKIVYVGGVYFTGEKKEKLYEEKREFEVVKTIKEYIV